jgi:hypothetical protein
MKKLLLTLIIAVSVISVYGQGSRERESERQPPKQEPQRNPAMGKAAEIVVKEIIKIGAKQAANPDTHNDQQEAAEIQKHKEKAEKEAKEKAQKEAREKAQKEAKEKKEGQDRKPANADGGSRNRERN